MPGANLAYISLQILASLDSHTSENLQRIFLKLHGLTKFGTINRFMEMNFCFNEKHKKSQFCVTSSKRSIDLKQPNPRDVAPLKRHANEASGSISCAVRQNDPLASFVCQNRWLLQ